MTKHPKPGANKPKLDPYLDSKPRDKCDITGSVEVRGEIVVNPPPSIAEKQDAESVKTEARDRLRLRVEVAGLVFVIIYAGLTALQVCETQEAVTAAQTANARALQTVRPWVGLESPILLSSINGQPIADLEYKTTIKNFGQSPAFNVIPEVDLIIGARSTDIRPEIDRICKHIEEDLLPIPLGVGEVIFPGGTHSFSTEGFPQRVKMIDQNLMRPDDPVYFFPGCIIYKDSGGKVIHRTKICQWADNSTMKEGLTLASCSRQSAD